MNIILAHLPPGVWASAVRAQLPFAANLKEACDRAYAHLLLQYAKPKEQIERASTVIFTGPRPTLVLREEDGETETMPAAILERRLKWRKS